MNDIYTPKNDPFRDARVDFETSVDLRNADLMDVDFEQYISPFALAISTAIDDAVMGAVMEAGVTVDKKELEKALRYDRDQYAAGYRAGKKAAVPKWISVEKRLPEDDNVFVLCAVKDGSETFATEGWYLKRNGHISPLDENYTFGDVTHWMPLPEPPKEE